VDIIKPLQAILKQKNKELKSINRSLPENIQSLINITENNNSIQIKKENEEYKALLISKDKEISKLNDLNTSKQNEINRLKLELENLKKDSGNKELEENFKKEKENLLNKINNLELKIYSLNEENEKLKLKIKELPESKGDNINNNIDNENAISNNNVNDINYEKELSNLRQLLCEYETGKIISDNTKKEIELLKNDSFAQIEQLKVKMDQINTINNSKLREYQDNINNANTEIKQKSKSITDFEKIIIKQENKIEELNKEITELNKLMLNKELSIKKNENYSIQLMNIINEQKLKIKNIKSKKVEQDNDEIMILKRQMENLKNEIDIKQNIILTMKKSHKSLQDKYLNICYSVRRKEQEDLLRQAKILQKRKMEREYMSNRLKSGKKSSMSALSLKMINGRNNSNNNKKIKMNTNRNKKNEMINFPAINSGTKFEENSDGEVINNDDKGNVNDGDNLKSINIIMKQIVEENN